VLTTTVDGAWALQVLTGIEVLAPELGLRPILPSFETTEKALKHPIVEDLRAAGVIDASNNVDAAVVEWLTVVARRDVALLFQVHTADEKVPPGQALLARFAQWWVVLERSEDLVRISAAGTATAEGEAKAVLNRQVTRLCGEFPQAPLRPVTFDVDTLLANVTNEGSLQRFLASRSLDADQVRILKAAADPKQSGRTSIVALQSGIETGEPTRTHIEQSVVTIIDTPEGRLLAEHVPSDGKKWMVLAPGTATNIASAIDQMVRRLPASEEWFSHRKAV
jgi:hypothetical protein